jgi:hypothetical protein
MATKPHAVQGAILDRFNLFLAHDFFVGIYTTRLL